MRAKFYVSAVKKMAYNSQAEITLTATTRKTGDNAQFFSATPTGSLTMTVTTTEARDWFDARLGKDLYIDFTDSPTE